MRDTTSGAALISALPGVELVEQADADSCCGFGGTFAIKFPEVSTAMGRDKVDHVYEAGAAELVSGDVGCLMHLGGVAAETDVPLVDDHAARAARARGLVAVSLVYGDDKALGDRIDKALGDTRLSTTLQASRRHLLEFPCRGRGPPPRLGSAVDRARDIRSAAVARAPELLDRFEQAVTAAEAA